ncbi:MAG: FAD:protein FMN transferase [Saprospiraceae bacterium]|nr:FAD:protein FMN transferase [Saprospiraceae bacterium]
MQPPEGAQKSSCPLPERKWGDMLQRPSLPKNTQLMRGAYLLLGLVFLLGQSCVQNSPTSARKAYFAVKGETMGTYYQIRYSGEEKTDLKREIDSLLEVINLEVSTYIPHSTISMFNQGTEAFALTYNPITKTDVDGAPYDNLHFKANLKQSKAIYELMEGYYDPTVMPLVNYWGFGYTEKRKVTQVDSVKIDSLIALVDFDKISWTEETNLLEKELPNMQLDFSSCAKGYGVDEVAQLLTSKGIEDYMVEIGGEVVVKGNNPKGQDWSIAVSLPKAGAGLQEFQRILSLKDIAVATSGNYRIFYEVEGEKFAHIISPITGFTEKSNLLSVSVFAKDCLTADAYATAFMVMGLDRAMAFASQNPDIEAYFIISKADGSMAVSYTEGIPEYLKDI